MITQMLPHNGKTQSASTPYWEDASWVNPPFDTYRIVELDIHTFTPEGTLSAATRRLGNLRRQGVNAVMLTGAVEQLAREQPNSFCRFVDGCHYEGIAVSINIAEPQFMLSLWSGLGLTRRAVRWFRDFHIDALRLSNAYAHAEELLQLLRRATNRLTARTGRQYYLLVECEDSPVAVLNQHVDRFLCPAEQPAINTGGVNQLAMDAPTRAYRREFLYESRFARLLPELFGRVT